MSWDSLNMSQRSELMSIYLKNGITSLDEMKKHYNSFAGGGFTSPDHDPNNPYHYHVNGQKVVVTPEDWEKYKNDPTFREVRAAIEAEQAAYPEPEYDEVPNPAWRKAYQNLVNGVNLRGRSNYLQPLPQGYTRDAKGVPMDAQGNYYLPIEIANDAPYFINQERGMMGNTVPVRYEQQQMPDRTIRQLRQPLPIDKVMNVDAERDNAINNYINSNTQYVQMYRRPYFKSEADPVIWVYGKKNALPSTSYVGGRGDAFGWHGFDIYDNDSKDAKQYSVNNLITEEEFKKAVDLIPGWGNYIDVQNPNLWIDKKITRKPSRQEAESNAVIPLYSFAEGGSIDDPPTNINVTTPLFNIQGTLPEDSSLEDRYKANDIAKGIEYAGNYFGSEGFKNRAIRANQRYGHTLYNLDDPLHIRYFPKRINFIKNNSNANAAFNFGLSLYENPIFAGGHETGHHVPLYNSITFGVSDDIKTQMANPNSTLYSPRYHNDYSQIPEEWRNILKPINPEDDHNAELSEAYSDLVGLRAVLKDYGIFDSDDPNAVFTQEMLDEFKKQLGSKTNRFLDYHSDENVIRAVNEIADAGKLNIGNYAADGGKIYIKPENRGKFTALKKRTGHSASWFKENGTPAQKKMAIFALNARKWKH